jgi:hypothetical protein
MARSIAMIPWQKLANELKTDPTLKGLTEEQIEAVIDVLLLTIHADKQVAFMEEAEFEHMLYELPWIKDKEEKVEAYVKTATERIKELEDSAAFRAAAESAATKLVEQTVRDKVYEMASTLAGVDMEVNVEEQEILNVLAECLEIPEDKRTPLK